MYVYRRGGCAACVLATHSVHWLCMFRVVARGFLCQLVSWSLVWRACVHVFSNHNINSELSQTARSVYQHRACLQTLRFGIPCFQRLNFVGFVVQCHFCVDRCLTLVLSVLVVCLFILVKLWGWRGGERWFDVRRPLRPPSHPSRQQHQHRATDSDPQVYKPRLTALTHWYVGLFPRVCVV